jgi:hypothetical protein
MPDGRLLLEGQDADLKAVHAAVEKRQRKAERRLRAGQVRLDIPSTFHGAFASLV